ncbi:MAG TPA: hypothetical protein VF574_05530 [Allosphingosinicella sp.]|jgi:hypothetical protein
MRGVDQRDWYRSTLTIPIDVLIPSDHVTASFYVALVGVIAGTGLSVRKKLDRNTTSNDGREGGSDHLPMIG